MVYIWLFALILFAVLEACTTALVSIWFAAASLVAMLCAALGFSLPVQIVVFVVFSALFMVLVRKFAKDKLNPNITPTNADRLIGEDGVVCEEINNLNGAGAVKIDGKVWSARSADNSEITSGEVVRIIKIDGVKLIVEKNN